LPPPKEPAARNFFTRVGAVAGKLQIFKGFPLEALEEDLYKPWLKKPWLVFSRKRFSGTAYILASTRAC
jgi:hypothetical protein